MPAAESWQWPEPEHNAQSQPADEQSSHSIAPLRRDERIHLGSVVANGAEQVLKR